MRVSKDMAVAICQDFGFVTADGWSEDKLTKQLGKLVRLFRSGEFELQDDGLVDEMSRLAKADEDDEPLEIGEEDDSPEEEELIGSQVESELIGSRVDEGEVAAVGCPLEVGDRVVVHMPLDDGGDWKGIVDEILSAKYVMVRDREGKTWETVAETCEVKIRAYEVESSAGPSSAPKSEKPRREPKPPKDEEEAEIRSLQERIQALKGKQKGNGGKPGVGRKLTRDEIGVDVLRAHPEGGILERLAEEVDARWQKQGRQGNPRESVWAFHRLVKVGVLFGLLKLDGRKVSWAADSEEK